MTISADLLIQFVRSRRELNLKTASHQKDFTVRAVGDGIEIEPRSTGTPRSVSRTRIERFCDELAESGSKDPGAYRDVTFDASYLLAIAEAVQHAKDSPK